MITEAEKSHDMVLSASWNQKLQWAIQFKSKSLTVEQGALQSPKTQTQKLQWLRAGDGCLSSRREREKVHLCAFYSIWPSQGWHLPTLVRVIFSQYTGSNASLVLKHPHRVNEYGTEEDSLEGVKRQLGLQCLVKHPKIMVYQLTVHSIAKWSWYKIYHHYHIRDRGLNTPV